MKAVWLNNVSVRSTAASRYRPPAPSVSVRERPCQSTTHAAKNNKLIIFFAGWGMSPEPFGFLDYEDNDVLMVFDYTDNDMPINLTKLLNSYNEIDLLAWSLGVAISNNIMQPYQDKLNNTLAINGTIIPINEQYGIAPDIFIVTIDNLLSGGISAFYRRMCKNPAIRKRFESTIPKRTPDSLRDELSALYRQLSSYTPDHSIFSNAIICLDDKIFTPDNQAGNWNKFNVSYSTLKEPHFPFYRWKAWREIFCRKQD